MRRLKTAYAIVAFAAVASYQECASAQWTAEVLHPNGALRSTALAVTPTQQIGNAYYSSIDHAILWSGTAASHIKLTPRGSDSSYARGASGNMQGGGIRFPIGDNRAVLWFGSASSWFDLTPAGALSASILGISATQQVGTADFTPGPGGGFAALWSGTAASMVNLAPSGVAFSGASAVAEGVQVGWVRYAIGEPTHAVMWSGSAASFVDLHPAGYDKSLAEDAAGESVQVGSAKPTGLSEDHAALWSGSAQSFIDMTPTNVVLPPFRKPYDSINATTGIYHAGVSRVESGDLHAGIWTGTDPNSFLSLHEFLPAGYQYSAALGICEEAGILYVVGIADDTHAVYWTGPAPDTCYADCDQSTGAGVLDVFDFLCFQNSFVNAKPYACDCDTSTGNGVCDVFDFLCFQNAFVGGCP